MLSAIPEEVWCCDPEDLAYVMANTNCEIANGQYLVVNGTGDVYQYSKANQKWNLQA